MSHIQFWHDIQEWSHQCPEYPPPLHATLQETWGGSHIQFGVTFRSGVIQPFWRLSVFLTLGKRFGGHLTSSFGMMFRSGVINVLSISLLYMPLCKRLGGGISHPVWCDIQEWSHPAILEALCILDTGQEIWGSSHIQFWHDVQEWSHQHPEYLPPLHATRQETWGCLTSSFGMMFRSRVIQPFWRLFVFLTLGKRPGGASYQILGGALTGQSGGP